jgi:hypothetical protein
MRITIWDMDFFYKFSFKPNITVMKLSSFHKQQEHIINFVNQAEDINYDFDLLYIIREHEMTPFPPSLLLDHKNTKLMGNEFKIFPNYFEANMVINMVRPDYSLYQLDEGNIYAGANMIQVLHNKEKLPVRQSEENVKKMGRQLNIITDPLIWKIKEDVLIAVLEELLRYKNIVFEAPIELKAVMSNPLIREKFIRLKFSTGVNQRIRNNYGHEFDQAKDIIDLMRDIKDALPHVRLSAVAFKTVIYNHWDDLNEGIKDLERCLKIMDYAKANRINIRFQSSSNRLITPFWPFFEPLDIWTEYHRYKSFVQLMLEPARKRQALQWHDILNNPKKWYSPRAEFLLHLLINHTSLINQYGLRLWGNHFLPKDQIDIDQISQYAFVFDQENIKAKLQKELIGDEAVVSGYRDNGI